MNIYLFRNSLIFGFLGALVFAIYFLLIYFLFENPFLPNPKSLDFFIYLISIAGSLWYYRVLIANNQLGFLGGFAGGFATTAFMATFSAFFIFIFLKYIDKDVLQLYISHTINQMKANEAGNMKAFGKEIYNQIIQQLAKTSPFDMAFFEFRSKLIIGGFMSLITTIVLRK